MNKKVWAQGMNAFSPKPRFRMYTSPLTYLHVFKDIVWSQAERGGECDQIETEIQRRFGVANCVCVPQARVGIYLALKALLKPGQKVVLSPYTIADVINMVICAGGVPVFADVERRTCNIDPACIEPLIDADTGALLVTHLHGLACSMDKIIEISKRKNIAVVEDTAQAFGAKFNGRWLGSFGDAGIFSFGRYKNINCFFGGMVVTPHSDSAENIRKELDRFPYMKTAEIGKRVAGCLVKDVATSYPFFQAFVYPVFRWGQLHNIGFINRLVESELDLSRKDQISQKYLRRMTPMQARLILSKLDGVEKDNSTRIKYAGIYHEGLADLPELTLPPLRLDGSHIYTAYPIQYQDRKALLGWMMKNRRDIGAQHLKNCADLPAFEEYYQDCPQARATAQEVILLPTYPRYSENEVRRNVEIIRAFFGK